MARPAAAVRTRAVPAGQRQALPPEGRPRRRRVPITYSFVIGFLRGTVGLLLANIGVEPFVERLKHVSSVASDPFVLPIQWRADVGSRPAAGVVQEAAGGFEALLSAAGASGGATPGIAAIEARATALTPFGTSLAAAGPLTEGSTAPNSTAPIAGLLTGVVVNAPAVAADATIVADGAINAEAAKTIIVAAPKDGEEAAAADAHQGTGQTDADVTATNITVPDAALAAQPAAATGVAAVAPTPSLSAAAPHPPMPSKRSPLLHRRPCPV